MIKRLIGTVAAVAFVLAMSTNADALSITDPGVVGAVDGLAGDNPGTDAALLGQAILDIVGANTDFVLAGGRAGKTGALDYSGTLIGFGIKTDVPEDGSNPILVTAGYTYAMAKYDGQNAGWVLFYLPTYGNALPANSYEIWGNNSGQYRMSNYTLFNPTSVPDGGMTLLLLGGALLGVGAMRRRFID